MEYQKFQRFAVETANSLPDVMISHYTGVYSQVLGVIYYVLVLHNIGGIT